MSFNKNSLEYERYLKNVKQGKIKIFITQIAIVNIILCFMAGFS